MREKIEDILEFIRFKICIFVCSISLCGYLLSNDLSITILFVLFASFFGTAGAYAFNNIEDKEEDMINRKKINPFVLSNCGILIVCLCFLISVLFFCFLPPFSVAFSVLGIISSFGYSHLRIKKYSIMKNIYTAGGVGTAFLVGATYINKEVLWYYSLFFFFIIIMSLISDLRDYRGDKKSNIGTLPVSIGYYNVRKIIYCLLSVFLLSVLLSYKMAGFLPFVFLMFYYLYKNNPSNAHSFGGYSFFFMTVWLFI